MVTMRRKPSRQLERCRIVSGPIKSDASYGNNGAFEIHVAAEGGALDTILCVVASDGGDWDHVSVHAIGGNGYARCPTWEEMDYVRLLFFHPEEWVIQYHVPTDRNINVHKYTLHMWRPQGEKVPIPPSWMVGPKTGHLDKQTTT
jgi:hypothetical protein